MKLLFRDSIHETIHLTLEPSPLCERQRKPLFPIRVSIRGYRLAGSIIIASRPFNNRLGPRHKGEGPRLVKNKLSKSRDPSPHLWTGRGQSVIIIRGCRCSIHPPLSQVGGVNLLTNLIPFLGRRQPRPLPSLGGVSARRNRTNLLLLSLFISGIIHRDAAAIEISKRLIKRTLFALCSCDKARGRRKRTRRKE